MNVQRRETERQAEMRLKSYSYHAQQEEHEPWIELEVRADRSQLSFHDVHFCLFIASSVLLSSMPADYLNARAHSGCINACSGHPHGTTPHAKPVTSSCIRLLLPEC